MAQQRAAHPFPTNRMLQATRSFSIWC